jgi:glycosyltransferase involved in cell wall biosynthesis
MKLRIAVVTSYFPTETEQYRGHSAYQTVRELGRWADLEVFCPLTEYPEIRWLQPRRFTYVRNGLAYSPPGVKTQYFKYPALPLLTRPMNGRVCASRLLKLVGAARPDLILNYNVYPDGYAAVHVGRKLGIPVVVCGIGTDLRRVPDPLTKRLTRWTLQNASAVITVSEELRRCAIRLGAAPDAVRSILNGCDSSVFRLSDRRAARAQLGLDTGAEVILFVGNLLATKGVGEMIEALQRLSRQRPNARLILVGDGPFKERAQALSEQAGIAGQVRLAGRCRSEQVATWLAAADVFCLPSYSEGCPNVVLEALACGRPVVATDVGGIPELVDSTCGILVPPRDAEKLAVALEAALARQWDEAAISQQFRRGWSRVAEEIYEICDQTMHNHTKHNHTRHDRKGREWQDSGRVISGSR